jgi:hypothetical protein
MVENEPERIEVAPCVSNRLASMETPELLGGHVRQRPAYMSSGRDASQPGVFRKIEVQQHGLAIVADENIGRLEVLMHNASFMCMGQSIRQSSAQP